MEAAGLTGGAQRQGKEGGAAGAGRGWALSAPLASYASACVQPLTSLSLLSEGTLPSILQQEGVVGAACLSDGESEDEMVLGLALCGLVSAHGPP